MKLLWEVMAVLNCVSFFLAAAIPFESSVRKDRVEQKRFPNYAVPLVGVLGALFHLNLFWGVFFAYRQLNWAGACAFQAVVFQATTSGVVLWLLCLVIVVYLVVCKSDT